MKLFAVETVSMFRHVYFVYAKNESDASDEVVCNEDANYFQKHIGEEIFSVRPVVGKDVYEIIKDTEQPDLDVETFLLKDWARGFNWIDYSN